MSFPDDFLWGVAAASYQIEGAAELDGRAPSVWDAFCRRPGAVFESHTGDGASDHYRRYPEDVALIGDLGAQAYRLSIAWPRVLPEGAGQANERGLDFYDRLVDALLARGVQPWVTLFHWDYPLALFHRGGWLNRESAAWFAHFADIIARRLGDRVRYWMTLNEPQCFLGLGHGTGVHAPGMRYARPDVLRATHHALLAHGRAVQAIRAAAGPQAAVGWAPHGSIPYPATTRERDVQAAREAMFATAPGEHWHFSTAWFADPVVLGRYPDDGLRHFGTELPAGYDRDLPQINQKLDFFGVNIYQGHPIMAGTDGRPARRPRAAGFPMTACGWPVEPETLYWGPRFLHERYRLPLYITENGCATTDWVHRDGKVHDTARIDFLARYLAALRRAIRDGADVRGYFLWSFLDNFEWAEGYRTRFGLTYVDYATQERIPKDSYMWYQQVILTNGACLPEHEAPLR